MEQKAAPCSQPKLFTLAAEQVAIHGKEYELYYEHEYEEMWRSAERSISHNPENR